MHTPAYFFQQSVTLLHIVPTARSDDVGPLVFTASTSRYHVINGVGDFEAVGATIAIS